MLERLLLIVCILLFFALVIYMLVIYMLIRDIKRGKEPIEQQSINANSEAPYVYCNECGVCVKRSYAQRFERKVNGCQGTSIEYYCQVHKLPYDKIIEDPIRCHYYKKQPEKEIAVNEKGKPIKYG